MIIMRSVKHVAHRLTCVISSKLRNTSTARPTRLIRQHAAEGRRSRVLPGCNDPGELRAADLSAPIAAESAGRWALRRHAAEA
jgi:hypothetical protein